MAKAETSHPCAHLHRAAACAEKGLPGWCLSALRRTAGVAHAGRALWAHKNNSASRLIANDFRLLWH